MQRGAGQFGPKRRTVAVGVKFLDRPATSRLFQRRGSLFGKYGEREFIAALLVRSLSALRPSTAQAPF
jgi:hypothetical protein